MIQFDELSLMVETEAKRVVGESVVESMNEFNG